jgi:hypothetical protein
MLVQMQNDGSVVITLSDEDKGVPRPPQQNMDLMGFVSYCFSVASYALKNSSVFYMPPDVIIRVDDSVHWWPVCAGSRKPTEIKEIRIKQREGGDNKELERVLVIVGATYVLFSEVEVDITPAQTIHLPPEGSPFSAVVSCV